MTPNNPISEQQKKMVRMAAYPVIFCIVGFIGFQVGIIGKAAAKSTQQENIISGVPSAKVKGFEDNKYNNALDAANEIINEKRIEDNENIVGSNETLTDTEKKNLIGNRFSVESKTKEQVLSEHSSRTNHLLNMQNKAIQEMYHSAPKSSNQIAEDRNISNAQKLNSYALELSRQQDVLARNYQNQPIFQNIQSTPPNNENQKQIEEQTTKTEISDVGKQNIIIPIKSIYEFSSQEPKNAFFGLKGEKKVIHEKNSSKNIEAVVHGDADVISVANGSNIKLRTLQDFKVNGVFVPKNSLITGSCAINAERVYVGISNLRIDNQIIELRLKAVDLDGIDGIYVPNLNLKSQVRQNLMRTTDAVSAPTFMMTPSNAPASQQILGQIAAQGTSTVLNGFKQIINQKSQVIKVSIKANHRLILVPVENR